MNKTVLLVFVCSLLFPRFVGADDAKGQPKELKDLQSKYQSDVQDAIKPIRDRYIDDLKDLLKLELAKGDVGAASAVKEEIKKAEAETPFSGTKWTAYWQGTVTIEFKSDGRWASDWNQDHEVGHWIADKDNTEVVVTVNDGSIVRYQLSADKSLVNEGDGQVYQVVK